jgi:hypothetical protein
MKKLGFMLTCKQASELISQSLDQRLSWYNRLKLRMHLSICDACTQFSRQLGRLRAAIKNWVSYIEHDDAIQLTAESKSRIASHVADNSET